MRSPPILGGIATGAWLALVAYGTVQRLRVIAESRIDLIRPALSYAPILIASAAVCGTSYLLLRNGGWRSNRRLLFVLANGSAAAVAATWSALLLAPGPIG